jgi:hypothetical protein
MVIVVLVIDAFLPTHNYVAEPEFRSLAEEDVLCRTCEPKSAIVVKLADEPGVSSRFTTAVRPADDGCDVLSESSKLEEELKALDLRQQELEARIREAQHRQRYSREPEAAALARADEQRLVKELDHLMTRSRAIEGRLLLAKSGRKTPW